MYAQQIKTISIDDLKNMMHRREKGYVIVDAREITAYYKGHIPGACSVFDGEISEIAKNLDKNANIIVYGPGQSTPSQKMEDRLAGDAASRIMNLGFKNVMVLDGGLQAYADAGNRLDMSNPGSIKTTGTSII